MKFKRNDIIIILFVIVIIGSISYIISNYKEINLPNLSKIEQIILEEDNKVIQINDYEDIKKIYKILVDKKSNEKSVNETPNNIDKFIKISFIVNLEEKCKMYIYTKNDMYYIEEPYNKIFSLTKKEYETITTYLSEKYRVGELSNINVTNDKIMMEIESLQDNKLTLNIKNMTNETYEYGDDYYIEIEKDGKWYKIDWTIEPSFNLMLHLIEKNENITLEIDASFKESLKKGKYRLVKYFASENTLKEEDIIYSVVEFEV